MNEQQERLYSKKISSSIKIDGDLNKDPWAGAEWSRIEFQTY